MAGSRDVVVTGASRGIGYAIAQRFAAAGDRVVAVGRDEAALAAIAAESPLIRPERCDVTDEQEVKALFARIGAVDVLVCNAGGAETAPLHRTTVETWRRLMEVNATSVFLTLREAVARMRAQGHGRVVVIASTAGRVGAPYTAAYTASKHAAVGLMRAAASELAGSGIAVNAVCPTFVDTPLTADSVSTISEKTGRSEAEARQALAGQSPLGRLLAPTEVAEAAFWLSGAESAAINGQTVVIDGGGIQA
jgi:NAD(P)-dependent dehydrogenase (short-subunit alcohol dehydrogenase family)